MKSAVRRSVKPNVKASLRSNVDETKRRFLAKLATEKTGDLVKLHSSISAPAGADHHLRARLYLDALEELRNEGLVRTYQLDGRPVHELVGTNRERATSDRHHAQRSQVARRNSRPRTRRRAHVR